MRFTMTKQKVKLQHYVPRFYLENFVTNIKKSKNQIFCFDKISSKTFSSSIKNIACESFFYDLSNDNEQSTEIALSKLENKFSIAIKNLIENPDINLLSSEDRETISEFIIIQEFRTKEFIETEKDSYSEESSIPAS